MSLVFQERADGYRAIKVTNGVERMVASIQTKRVVDNPPGVRINDRGERVLVNDNPHGASTFEALPRGECTVHSTGGPMVVADLEEILNYLPNKDLAQKKNPYPNLDRKNDSK